MGVFNRPEKKVQCCQQVNLGGGPHEYPDIGYLSPWLLTNRECCGLANVINVFGYIDHRQEVNT